MYTVIVILVFIQIERLFLLKYENVRKFNASYFLQILKLIQ